MEYKKLISEFYGAKCAEHRDEGWKAALYATPDNQYGTFVNLMKIVAGKTGGTLLDVGCGQGDLFEFVETRGLNLVYSGIDLCPTMIGYAKARFPDGTFRVQDILEYDQSHDFVIAASVFDLALPDQKEYTQNMIRQMFRVTGKWLAFNMLSDAYRDYERQKELFYYDPAEIIGFCLGLTPYLWFDHSTSGYDFCVYLKK
jgi:SAM-dependent methyltransferase